MDELAPQVPVPAAARGFHPHPAVAAANPIELFVRRFDVANVDQNLVKLVLDFTPAPLLDLGLEAIYKENEYKDTPLGRTEDTRQEVYASVGYGDPKNWRVHALRRHRVPGIRLDAPRRRDPANSEPGGAASRRAHERHLQLDGEERGQVLAGRHRRRLDAARPAVAQRLADLRRNRRHDRLHRAARDTRSIRRSSTRSAISTTPTAGRST